MKYCPWCLSPFRFTPGATITCDRKFVDCWVHWHGKEFSEMDERDPLLQEREKTHGPFENNAAVSQSIKSIFLGTEGIHQMKVVHREALDMIAVKLSRILSGQANYKDHWDDIAGYAKLAAEACNG